MREEVVLQEEEVFDNVELFLATSVPGAGEWKGGGRSGMGVKCWNLERENPYRRQTTGDGRRGGGSRRGGGKQRWRAVGATWW